MNDEATQRGDQNGLPRAHAQRFGFKETELCYGLDAVMKQGSFYDWAS